MQGHAFSLAAVTSFVAFAAVASHAFAAAPPEAGGSEVEQLRSAVKDLQQQVDALKSQNDDQWLTERRADEVRGLVQEVLADADTRATLLQSGAVSGYDKGFFVGSSDGNFLLRFAGQMQVRWVYNSIDSDAEDEEQFGFENRRTKVRFYGHVVDPSWHYLVLGAFDRDGGSFVLDEAFITKDFGNGAKLRVGQFKAPFLREELVSSSKQLAVERSLINEEFNQDRVQGVEFSWTGDKFRVAAAYSDGFRPGGNGTDNTTWQTDLTEWGALTARVEFLAMGEDFKAADDFQGWKGNDQTLLLGAAAHYQESEIGAISLADETEFFSLTADATFKANGFGVYGAVVYRSVDDDGALDNSAYGFLIQGSYMLAEDWEVFARYEWGDDDIDGTDDLSIITAGVNKYWSKHNLKWQADLGYALNEVSSTWSTSSAGWRTDAAGEDGQFVFRTQIQLLF